MTDGLIPRLNAALEGRYTLDRKLGEGGMATVYLAKDLKHNRNVALKVLKPELAAVVGADRFLAEIETTANLQHPHILPLFDSGEADGETLRERIDREHQLPVDEAVRIAVAVSNALAHAHDRGVIHRDIKPANILMQDNEPLVADFGIALAVGAAGGSRLTETGLSVGTPFYMSPEQATGDQSIGPTSDQYAVAAVLYEMLTGEPPYTGTTAQAVLGRILQGQPVSATAMRQSVPANVDAAVRKALEKLPADRFTGVQAFAQALRDPGFQHGAEAAAAADLGPWRQVSLSTGALAGVLGLALAWVVFGPAPEAAPEQVSRFAVIVRSDQSPGGHFDVSPDGSAIVFRAEDDQGVESLWLRRLDSFEPTLVPGTDPAPVTPDISPDGTEVAFVSGQELKVAPLEGGVVRVLADDANCCVRWGPDGYVYFSPNARGIARVPAQGGETEDVLTADNGEDGQYGDFQVLPGGDVAVFTVWADLTRIEAMRLSTGERRVLAPGVKASYTPDGHLIFASLDGELMAAPFDPEAMELTGSPVPIVEGVVVSDSEYPFYSLSATGTLVYWAGEANTNVREFVWVDRSGAAAPVDPGWSFDRGNTNAGWSLSPDGTRLALRALTESGYDIWVKELDAGPFSRLTFDAAEESKPRWTADGRQITFLSVRSGGNDVWVKRADGAGEAELVYDFERDVAQGFWSSDGEWMILRVAGPMGGLGGRDILAVRPDSNDVPLELIVGEADEAAPALSPDGKWLAYNSNETGRFEVFVRPFPNVEDGKWQVSTNGGMGPLWAHSGNELFYVDRYDQMVAAEVQLGEALRVSDREILFEMSDTYEGRGPNAYITGLYDITPDDQRFLMARVFREDDTEAESQLVVVQRWFEELRARIGN
jgi:serine/threonine-protein kinase